MSFTLQPMNPEAYRRDTRRITLIIIAIFGLLAMLLSLDGLFRQDLDDGSLEQLLVKPEPIGPTMGWRHERQRFSSFSP